jgi:hypothetical protein
MSVLLKRFAGEGNANAEHMNNDSNYDVGLWQINTQNWADWYVCLIA